MEERLTVKTQTDDRQRNLLSIAERIIQQGQYEVLNAMQARKPDPAMASIEPGDVACLFQVSELVFSRTEGSRERLATVMNALHASGASAVLLLQCHSGRCEMYIGAVNKRRYDNVFFLNTIREVLRVSLEGNLPGTVLREIVSRQAIEDKLDQCLDDGFDSQCVTAISCVPGEGGDRASARHGIERLLEAVGNRNFTIMVLADPVDAQSMDRVRMGYEALGSQLSAMEQQSVSVQSSTSVTQSENYSRSESDSWGENISLTQSHTTGTGWSRNEESSAGRLKKVVAAGAGAVTGNFMTMSIVSNLMGQNQLGKSGHEDQSTSLQGGRNRGGQISEQTGTGRSVADSRSTTQSSTATDFHVKGLLERINRYLSWLDERENVGMFNSCTYVISSDAGTNLMVASQYQALMQGGGNLHQPVTINTWTQENGVDSVRASLMRLSHPSFGWLNMDENFTPGMLMGSRELAAQMALPQSSIVGVTVTEYAAYGREVVRKTPIRSGKVLRLGTVSHMGRTSENQPVILDLQSMAAHTFVAGTNGSGKSNTVFRLLEGLMEAAVPFLVIEPAKGEYKNVFGREPSVKVFGTNRRKTELLQLNPFWFNEDVDILEHIDKLMDVFNASWSMYAAMPAVLKAAIGGAYTACGWDLKTSVCRGGVRIFPTVRDVLDQFNAHMDSTAFSQEVKGNYVGALSTRMESLCDGIYGEIFGGGNLPDEMLFDGNVIIDLSRVGSVETKSMLMGMLVIRLQEYRMRAEAMNLPLKHITVLEEAHNLLRRTSTAQSGEGSNLLGKSVEMISNAIAEMRSYGEGFIIVDQSPRLLDMSVMRNTNTKIILRLPESSDRELVGNTMGLTAEQTYEISRFKTGLCAVYQQNWLEAVLCQVDRAAHEEILYERPAETDEEALRRRIIVRALITPWLGAGEEHGKAAQAVLESRLSGVIKRRLLSALKGGEANWTECASMISALSDNDLEPLYRFDRKGVDTWLSAQMSDEALVARWGECLPYVIHAQVESLSASLPEWKTVLRSMTPMDGGGPLPRMRGIAFARTCPLTGRLEDVSDEDMEEVYAILKTAGGADARLAGALRNAIDTGTVRQRGELQPYADIAWALMDGQAGWDELYDALVRGDCARWDALAREVLGRVVIADRDTQTSILSLYLQRKGALSEVRRFYSRWLMQARSARQS